MENLKISALCLNHQKVIHQKLWKSRGWSLAKSNCLICAQPQLYAPYFCLPRYGDEYTSTAELISSAAQRFTNPSQPLNLYALADAPLARALLWLFLCRSTFRRAAHNFFPPSSRRRNEISNGFVQPADGHTCVLLFYFLIKRATPFAEILSWRILPKSSCKIVMCASVIKTRNSRARNLGFAKLFHRRLMPPRRVFLAFGDLRRLKFRCSLPANYRNQR